MLEEYYCWRGGVAESAHGFDSNIGLKTSTTLLFRSWLLTASHKGGSETKTKEVLNNPDLTLRQSAPLQSASLLPTMMDWPLLRRVHVVWEVSQSFPSLSASPLLACLRVLYYSGSPSHLLLEVRWGPCPYIVFQSIYLGPSVWFDIEFAELISENKWESVFWLPVS